jgi:hypothetical protein
VVYTPSQVDVLAALPVPAEPDAGAAGAAGAGVGEAVVDAEGLEHAVAATVTTAARTNEERTLMGNRVDSR